MGQKVFHHIFGGYEANDCNVFQKIFNIEMKFLHSLNEIDLGYSEGVDVLKQYDMLPKRFLFFHTK